MIPWNTVLPPDATLKLTHSEVALEYSSEVERYFREPVNIGCAETVLPHQIQGEAGSIGVGTWIVIQAYVQGGQLEGVKFLAYGCPHTIAACSWMTEKLAGAPVGELVNFAPDWITDKLDIPVEKKGKLLILKDALERCFDGWETGIKVNDGNYVDR